MTPRAFNTSARRPNGRASQHLFSSLTTAGERSVVTDLG
jgi:hypothetical protein